MTHPIPDEALDADIAILGIKGAGKTYTGKGIVERLLDDGARVLILDPLSTWWGLKSSADGESPGYPVAVFGGPHGDMELTESMAAPLAEIIATNNLPAVMDIAFMGKAESQRFCKVLLEELFRLNRDPLTIVLEEAHVFAPQSVGGSDAHVFYQVDRIARMGRAFGFRLLTMTQRPARLHKDVLSQASTLVAMRLRAPQDRDAVKAWVDGNGDRDKAKEIYDSLASLDTGEGWVWASDQDVLTRARFPRIKTLDSSATPKRGESRIEPKTLAEVDLSAVREALAPPPPAEDEPTQAEAAKPVDWEAKTAEREKAARLAGHRVGLKEGYSQGLSDGIALSVEALTKLKEARALPPKPLTPPASEPKPEPQPRQVSSDDASLSGPARRVIAALQVWRRLGHLSPTRYQIAFLAGYSPKSSAFTNTLGSLRSGGYADYPESGKVALTDAGWEAEGEPLQDGLMARLSGPQARVLEPLKSGAIMDRETLASHAEYSASSSAFTNTLGSLRSLGLIDYPKPGHVQIESWVTEAFS